MGFGASWVFLYPLPFYGSGNWGAWATGLFSFSVLLVGLAIVTWCFGDPPHGREPLLAPRGAHEAREPPGIGDGLGVSLPEAVRHDVRSRCPIRSSPWP